MRTGIKLLLATVLVVAVASAAGWLAVEHGWLRFNNPPPARFPVWGLDVSHYQGAIDWPRVAGEPNLQFVYIKATEGGDFVDPRFAENWREARKAGLKAGAYHFFTFCRPALDQARHYLAILPKEPGALPPAVDLEFGGNCRLTKPATEIQQDLQEWLQTVESALSRRAVIYATRDAFETFLEGYDPIQSPIWIRDVWTEPQPPPGRQWTFWQFADRGRVRGIAAPVDLNVFFGDRAALEQL